MTNRLGDGFLDLIEDLLRDMLCKRSTTRPFLEGRSLLRVRVLFASSVVSKNGEMLLFAKHV